LYLPTVLPTLLLSAASFFLIGLPEAFRCFWLRGCGRLKWLAGALRSY